MDEGRWRRRWRDGMMERKAMARWGDVPAVRRARRRVDRLRGGQPCRRALGIRSEVSGPPSWFRGRWAGDGALVRLLFLGRAGWGYAGRCPDPPRNLRFLGFSICCRVFGRNGVRTQNAGAAPRPSRDCAVSSYLPFPRNAPQQSSRDHRGEGCVSFERQQLGAGSACWALPRPAKEP